MLETVVVAGAYVALGLFALSSFTVYLLRNTIRAPLPEADELEMVPVEFRSNDHFVETVDGRYRHVKDKANEWLYCERGDDEVLRSRPVTDRALHSALNESYRRWELSQSRAAKTRAEANRLMLEANRFDLNSAQAELNRQREHPAYTNATSAAWDEVYAAARLPAPVPPLPGEEFAKVGKGWFESADGLYRSQHGNRWFETSTGNEIEPYSAIDKELCASFKRWKTLRSWNGK